ncbi:hypothetical protein [Longimicrobium sp.]|uniref:hypothetical protein n=1 Tax=Longimicrobium sp. TaxID=2029185 RepID=UPI002E37DFA4|nr:hypothetical protein [Longimicrobium sp.]HEX6040071.1 hypothetical protein [Longimicrobium sp.]
MTLRRLRTAVFAGGVGAALAFGAATLRADVNPAAACLDTYASGSCTSTDQCATYCRGVQGAETGHCISGCCWCLWS